MRTATNIARFAAVHGVLVALLLALVAACGGPPGQPGSIAVGSEPNPESVLLANLYAAALRSYGTPAHVEQMDDPLTALDSGKLGVVPGFTGQLLQTFAPDAAARTDEQVYRAMVGVLPEGVAAGDYTIAAEDKPAVAITGAAATAWGGRDLGTLTKYCAEIRPGAVRGADVPVAVGRCTLAKPREFHDSAALFDALRTGQINAAWTTTSDPGIPDDVVLLVDHKPMLIRAQNAVSLYRRNELSPRQILAINEIAGVLDTAALRQMRRQVLEGADPRAVAEAWLEDNPLGR
jgi:glycine betaine/choline ABC-type transport system substrate-binding protein